MDWIETGVKVVGGLLVAVGGIICVVVAFAIVITVVIAIANKLKSKKKEKVEKRQDVVTPTTKPEPPKQDLSLVSKQLHQLEVFESIQVVQKDAIARKDTEAQKSVDNLLVHLLGCDAAASNGNKPTATTPIHEDKGAV